MGKGCILDDERARLYASIVYKGSAARFAFAAAIFGEFSEALFWLQLPHALSHFVHKSANRTQETSESAKNSEAERVSLLNRIASRERCVPDKRKKDALVFNIVMVIFCSWLIFIFMYCSSSMLVDPTDSMSVGSRLGHVFIGKPKCRPSCMIQQPPLFLTFTTKKW